MKQFASDLMRCGVY